MDDKRFKSLLGHSDEQYFANSSPDEAGDLLAAGMSLPLRASDWWPMCELWNYPYYTLNLILEGGSGSYRHENGFECELAYGNFFLTSPDCKQHYGPGKDQRWSELYVGFSGAVFDSYFQRGALAQQAPVWLLENPQPWIMRLQGLLRAPLSTTRFGIAQRATHFLSILFEMLETASPVTAGQAMGDWFSQACLLLTGDMHRKVDLHCIADELGMSYDTFRQYFTRRAGLSPMRYREKQRIKAACELLENNPHKSCKQIAFSLGYYSGDHFSAHFKRHQGLSPRVYRKQYREKSSSL